jgi:hypothetical protein
VLRMLSARVEDVSASIGHRVTQGLANEEALREIIRDSLPFHVGVGDGVIVGSGGESSKQVDIILYDRRRGNPMISPLTKIFFADQTYAVVEVKTTYTKPALAEALANIQSVKRLSVADSSWTEWEGDGAGGQALVKHDARPPLGVVIFLRADLPSGPVDLANHFGGMKEVLDAVPPAEQPDLVVSVGHACTFRHVDIGNHSAATQQFSVTLLQDAQTQQPMSIDADPSTGAVVTVGEPALGFGRQDAVEVMNSAGNRRVLVVRPDSFGEATVHKLASAGGGLHILDPGRSLLLALSSLEQLVRVRKLNPAWGLQHYLGSDYGMASVYPDDLRGAGQP